MPVMKEKQGDAAAGAERIIKKYPKGAHTASPSGVSLSSD